MRYVDMIVDSSISYLESQNHTYLLVFSHSYWVVEQLICGADCSYVEILLCIIPSTAALRTIETLGMLIIIDSRWER
jgi:hypothetical protein